MPGPRKCSQQKEEVEGAMNQGSTKGNEGKDPHRENDFLDVARGAAHRGWGAGDCFGKDVEGDQATVEYQPERCTDFLLRPTSLEYLPEDIGENGQHDKWVEKHPGKAEHGTTVTQQDVTLDELSEQVAVGDKAGFCLHLNRFF